MCACLFYYSNGTMNIIIPMILDPLGANDDDEDDDDEQPAKLEDIISHQTSTTAEGPYAISSVGNNVHSSKISQLLYPTDTKNKQSSAQKVRCIVTLTVQCHKTL